MRKLVIAAALAVAVCVCGCGQLGLAVSDSGYASTGADNTLYVLPDGVKTRWASPENWKGLKGSGGMTNAGRKGSPSFLFKAGDSKVLAEVRQKSGMVRRIWVTISKRTPQTLRGIRIDMYWDGAEKPAVSAPFGDFFCHGLGKMARFDNALFSSPEARSFNCRVPMPFKKGMKIVVTNQSDTDVSMFYDVDYTLGDKLPDDVLYFHTHWRRENPTTLKQDYELLPKVQGAGRFLGVNVGVVANQEKYYKAWWGEGEVKVYLDGDEEYPTLCGTGTEDYIGTAWGQGHYANRYQGCHLADHNNMEYCFYRFHIPDPVYFRQDIRVTIHQIGWANAENLKKITENGVVLYKAGLGMQKMDPEQGGGLFERQDDWSSCAYFYLDRPTNNLPALADPEERKF